MYEKYLLDNEVCDQAYMDNLKAELDKELQEMVDRAAAAPITTKDKVYKMEYIWATVETGGEM